MAEQVEEPAEQFDVQGLAAPYVVSKILGIYVGKDSKRYYRVKWEDSWEPEEQLMQSCQKLLNDFWSNFTFSPSNMQSGTHVQIKAENYELQSPTSTEPNLAASEQPTEGDLALPAKQNDSFLSQGHIYNTGKVFVDTPSGSGIAPRKSSPCTEVANLDVHSTLAGNAENDGPQGADPDGTYRDFPPVAGAGSSSGGEAPIVNSLSDQMYEGHVADHGHEKKPCLKNLVGVESGIVSQSADVVETDLLVSAGQEHSQSREVQSQHVGSNEGNHDIMEARMERSSKKRLQFSDPSVVGIASPAKVSRLDISTGTQTDQSAPLLLSSQPFANDAQCPNVRTYNAVRSPAGFDAVSGRNYSAQSELIRLKNRLATLATSVASESETVVSSSRMPAADGSTSDVCRRATLSSWHQSVPDRNGSGEDDQSSVATVEGNADCRDFGPATGFTDEEGQEMELDIHGNFDPVNDGLPNASHYSDHVSNDAQEQMAWSDPEGDIGYWKKSRRDIIEVDSDDEIEITGETVSPSKTAKPGFPAGFASGKKNAHRPTRNQIIGMRSQATLSGIPHYVSPGRARQAAGQFKRKQVIPEQLLQRNQRPAGAPKVGHAENRSMAQSTVAGLQRTPQKQVMTPQHPRARLPGSSPSSAAPLHPRNRLYRNGQAGYTDIGATGLAGNADRMLVASADNESREVHSAATSLSSPTKYGLGVRIQGSSKEQISGVNYPLSPTSTAAVLDGHRCKACNVEFQNITLARQHAKRMHLFPSQDQGLTCDVCQAMFSNRNALRSHMLLHSEAPLPGKAKQLVAAQPPARAQELPFVCEICGKRFRQRPHLVIHMGQHGRNEESSFSCPECGQDFTREEEFALHMREHNAHLPFCCNLCQERFSSRPELLSHLESHNQGRPHTCPICKKSFKTKTYLCGHMQFHKRNGQNVDVSDAAGVEQKQVIVKSQVHDM